jgi:hypothetical protein
MFKHKLKRSLVIIMALILLALGGLWVYRNSRPSLPTAVQQAYLAALCQMTDTAVEGRLATLRANVLAGRPSGELLRIHTIIDRQIAETFAAGLSCALGEKQSELEAALGNLELRLFEGDQSALESIDEISSLLD